MAQLRVALAQINPVVGDLEGNAEQVLRWTADAADAGAHLVAFPEMALTGYPVEDLALRPVVRRRVPRGPRHAGRPAGGRGARRRWSSSSATWTAATGRRPGARHARTARRRTPPRAAPAAGSSRATPSTTCPTTASSTSTATSSPVDSLRSSGCTASTSRSRSARTSGRRAARSPVAREAGAGLLRRHQRLAVRAQQGRRAARARARGAPPRRGCALAYVNMVGGQDELVFDGDSTGGRRRRRAARPGRAVRGPSCSSSTWTCPTPRSERPSRRRPTVERGRARRADAVAGLASRSGARRGPARRRGRGLRRAGDRPARLRRARTGSGPSCSACPAASTRR